MKNLFDLTGKIAVVTGGAGLLGRSFVETLADHGANVYVAEIEKKNSARLPESVKVLRMDIANPTSVEKGIRQVLRESGSVDIWVNNAYPRTKDWNLKFEKIPASSWRKNVDAHLNGYCLSSQKVAEAMKKQKSGVIINIASIYGMSAPDFSIYEGTSMTMPAAYAAIKGGIVNFTRYLASYYGKYGIRVNSISPGGVLNGQPKKFIQKYLAKTPLKRMAKPADIAGALIYLVSPASEYVTGHNLVVDGGFTVS